MVAAVDLGNQIVSILSFSDNSQKPGKTELFFPMKQALFMLKNDLQCRDWMNT